MLSLPRTGVLGTGDGAGRTTGLKLGILVCLSLFCAVDLAHSVRMICAAPRCRNCLWQTATLFVGLVLADVFAFSYLPTV